jgi:hypothetical protein
MRSDAPMPESKETTTSLQVGMAVVFSGTFAALAA